MITITLSEAEADDFVTTARDTQNLLENDSPRKPSPYSPARAIQLVHLVADRVRIDRAARSSSVVDPGRRLAAALLAGDQDAARALADLVIQDGSPPAPRPEPPIERTVTEYGDVVAALSGDCSGNERGPQANVRCPLCGEDYVHVVAAGTLTGSDELEAVAAYPGTEVVGRTVARRSALRVVFWCENCAETDTPTFGLVVQQHKGNELLALEIYRLPPRPPDPEPR